MVNFLDIIGDSLNVNAHTDRGKRILWFFAGITAAVGALAVILGTWKVIALAIALVIIAAAFIRPELILLGLAVYTPFEPFPLKFVQDDIYIFARYFSEGLIYILAASAILHIIARRRTLGHTPIDLPFILFVLTIITAFAINTVPLSVGILGARQIIRFMLLFFIVVYLDPDREFIRRTTLIMLGIAVFQGVLGLAQAIIGAPLDEFLIPSERRFFESIQLTSGTTQFWSPGSRVFATMGRFDQLGTFLSFFFLIAAGIWYQAKDALVKRRMLIMVAVAFPAFILTLSRASWFGFALGLFIVGAIIMKDRRIRAMYAGLVAIAVAYVAYSGLAIRYLIDYYDQTIVERFFEAFSYERWRGEYIGLGRLFWIVQTILVVVPAAPIFGWGPGQYGGGAAAALGSVRVYEELNLPYGIYGTEGYIDNNWFSVWGETGTVGFALYIWMFIALGTMAYRVFRMSKDSMTRGLALGFMGAISAVTFQAFLATYLEVRTLALYLWVYAAFVFVLGRREGIFNKDDSGNTQ